MQPFFGLALAATLLREPVTPTMLLVTVAVIGCVVSARKVGKREIYRRPRRTSF